MQESLCNIAAFGRGQAAPETAGARGRRPAPAPCARSQPSAPSFSQAKVLHPLGHSLWLVSGRLEGYVWAVRAGARSSSSSAPTAPAASLRGCDSGTAGAPALPRLPAALLLLPLQCQPLCMLRLDPGLCLQAGAGRGDKQVKLINSPCGAAPAQQPVEPPLDAPLTCLLKPYPPCPLATRGGTSRKAAVGRSSRVTLGGAVGGRE